MILKALQECTLTDSVSRVSGPICCEQYMVSKRQYTSIKTQMGTVYKGGRPASILCV